MNINTLDPADPASPGTIIDGNTAPRAGGGIETLGPATLRNVTLTGNTATGGATVPGNGGGLHVTGAADVTITGGLVRGNIAEQEGGGLWNDTGTMMIDGTAIDANTARSANAAGDAQGGGGVFNNGGVLMIAGGTTVTANVALDPDAGASNDDGGGGIMSVGGTVQIRDAATRISGNFASDGAGNGGGVQMIGGTLTISDAVIAGNTAARAGGGIESNAATTTLTGATLDGNTATINGGGVHVTGAGTTNVGTSTFQNNTAGAEGGGLWNSGTGTMTVANSTVTTNTASGAAADQGGGGIFNDGGTLSVFGGAITGNTASGAAGSGGGIFNGPGGRLTINVATPGNPNPAATTISGNAAVRAGGGIETLGNATLMNVNLDNNTATGIATATPPIPAAPGNGGGLHSTGSPTVSITGGSVSGNSAAAEGGGLWNDNGVMTVTGTVIDGNTALGTAIDQSGGGAFNNGVDAILNLIGVQLSNNRGTEAAATGGGAFNFLGTMNVTGSTIFGNDFCGLTYLRPNGMVTGNTFPNAVNGLAVNVGGDICPIFANGGGEGDDEIFVRSTSIAINDDVLVYDSTAGALNIQARGGNDRVNIRSTAATNPITVDLGTGNDTVNVVSVAPDGSGTLDLIQGDINLIGGADLGGPADSATVTGRQNGNLTQSVTTTTTGGDTLNLSDVTSGAANTYALTPTTFARTLSRPTGTITYNTFETLSLQTGSGDDRLNVTGTADGTSTTINTGGGNDAVNVAGSGADSLLRIDTAAGSDTITLITAGDRSITQLFTAAGNDTVVVNGRGDNNGIAIVTGDGIDSVTIGAAATIGPAATGNQSIIAVAGGGGNDTVNVLEVFADTIVDLSGEGGDDTFNLTAAGSDAAGMLTRLNNDPVGGDATTRQLFIDGGGNGTEFNDPVTDGILVTAGTRLAQIQSVQNVPVGDTINLDASAAVQALDLRYVITGAGRGVLATTPPAADSAARATVGNEVFDNLNVENVNIKTGSANDILTVSGTIPLGIAGTAQIVRFDGGLAAPNQIDLDRLEIRGGDAADFITVGNIGGVPEPFEIANVPFVRLEGRGGDDQLVNQSDAIGVLDGGAGNDVLAGGTAADALTGGPGRDDLFGRGGDDVLFSDLAFGSDMPQPVSGTDNFDGELLDGGDQVTTDPGDVCVQIGLDLVRNCEVLGDGGAEKDVLTLLRSRLVPVEEISFEDASELLIPFGPVANPAAQLLSVTEPNLLASTGPAVVNPLTASPAIGGPAIGNAATGNPATPDPVLVLPSTGGAGTAPLGIQLDINGDGRISALDALFVINQLNNNSMLSGNPSAEPTAGLIRPRGDVSGDGTVSARDALMVINHLNATGGVGEPIPATPVAVADSALISPSTVDPNNWASAVDELFADEDRDERRRLDSASTRMV